LKPIKVGILGLGTVGGGTVRILKRNATEIARRAGREIIITHASVSDLNKPRICDIDGIELTTDSFAIIQNPEIDIIVECIGGTGTVKDMVLQAIACDKHVITANKALIAIHGNEIFAKASEQGVIVAFEAAVAGGIPIIKAIREGLTGNQIEWVAGIINGTSNFILTDMRFSPRNFADALTEAKLLGYAEADPAFDVEGIDAAHKLTILASIAFGIPLQFDKVYTEGITKITRQDIKNAEQLGYRIKHLGLARKTAEGIELRVHPTLIPKQRLIANVNGVMNAVLVKGDAVGATLYYGAGAGAEATGSAVVADIVDVARALTTDPENRVPHLAFQAESIADIPVLSPGNFLSSYYLRLFTEDKTGVLADVTRILANHQISIEAINQKQPLEEETRASIVILTDITPENEINAAIAEIEALKTVNGKIKRIRVESLG
jgi:homoserine dehydrogenase